MPMSKNPPPNPACSICHKTILPGAGRSRRGPTGMHIECEKTKQYWLSEPDVRTKGPSLPGGTLGSLFTRSVVPLAPRSAKMQALIEKIEAADAAHFAALRERGKAQADALAKARTKTLEKKRVARPVQASAGARRKAKRQRPSPGEAR